MTDKTQALRDLLAKVEAGADHITILEYAGNWAYAHGHAGLYVYVIDAYNGSLNAAKALHEAVLPGWIGNFGTDGFAKVAKGGRVQTVMEVARVDGAPARAWLIAILRALISQAAP